MKQYSLPEKLRGNWIWVEADKEQPESYGLFRKEFVLDELPDSAELWIAARSFCHIFINDDHLSYGLDICQVAGSYTWNFEISYLLNTGANVISVLCHNTSVARTSCLPQPNGLWCQLNVDGKPFLWTDNVWQCRRPAWYLGNRPRHSASLGFTEKSDFRKKHERFKAAGNSTWGPPSYSVPLQEENWELIPFPAPPMTVSQANFEKVIASGKCHQKEAYSNISFETMRQAGGDGVYGAETYLHIDDALETNARLFADNPCRLFVNGKLVYEQDVEPVLPGKRYNTLGNNCFMHRDNTDRENPVALRKGWNRLTCFEEVVAGTCGLAIALTGLAADSVHFLRHPDQDSMPGWSVIGPLRTPLANTLGHILISELENLQFYIPVTERPVDESAYLTTCFFSPGQGAARAIEADEKLTLQQGDYVVLALPQCSYGCPVFRIEGSANDIIDVVTSDEMQNGYVPPYNDGQRNVDTLILGEGEFKWIACLPRGVSYLMLVARYASDKVTVSETGVAVREYDFENCGRFDCSDLTLNRIWRTGQRTLFTTIQEIFIDSPSRDITQYVGDAMIQSWAAYHLFGDFGLAAKSLQEFAQCQFETGELPAACPSSFYFNIPDYALLWPIWLQQHYFHTGAMQCLKKLLPNLERLLGYFASIADPGTGLLNDLEKYGGYSFLDHADIDRQGIVTGLNALYSRALLSSSYLFKEAGRTKDAERLKKHAASICAALRNLCWNAELGLFADSYHDGGRSESYSLQTSILALYGAVANKQDYNLIFDNLFTNSPPYYKKMNAETNNPYFNYFILQVAFALGRRRWALDFMRWYWNGMLEAGAVTWWELFDPRKTNKKMFVGSKCHGYGTSPNGFLISEIAGIRPAKPGFTAIYFNPLTQGIKTAKVTVPTPYGHIMVEWELKEGNQLEAVIDANYPLSVIPELEPDIAASALIRVSDEVTVFAAAD